MSARPASVAHTCRWRPLPVVLAAAFALTVVGCTLESDFLQVAGKDGARGVGRATGGASGEANAGFANFGDYLAGRHAEIIRETGIAADRFLKVLKVDPQNTSLMRRVVNLLIMEGRWDEAARIVRRLLPRAPEAQVAGLVLVVEDIRENRLEVAAERLSKLSPRGINGLMQPLLLAWVRVGLKDRAGAVAAVAPLRENSRHRPLHDLHAGLIHDFLGVVDEAERLYGGVRDKPPVATFRVLQILGSFLEREGRADEAAALYERFRSPYGEDVDLPANLLAVGGELTKGRPITSAKDGMAEAFLGIANALSNQGASDIALVLARFSLELRPQLVFARLLVADIFEVQRRFRAAHEVLDEIDPESLFYWSSRLRMARNLRRMNQAELAISELRRMGETWPERAEALILLGDILRGQERFIEAVRVYDDAVARIPEIAAEDWSVLYHRGIALERSRQWTRAEKDFLAALELKPDQPLVLNYLGYSWVDMGLHLDRAQRMIERAVELRPNDGFIVDSLGWVLYRLGDYQRAASELERAVELRPQDPVINDHLGDVYWKVGRFNEARFQWRRALALDPQPNEVPKIEAKLTAGLDERRGAR